MGLIKAVSTTADGNMSFRWGEKTEVEENRRKFLARMKLKQEDCVYMSLNHGVVVAEVGRGDRGKMVKGDAVLTVEAGVGLFLLTADCFPVVFHDPVKQILVLAHLGRLGIGSGLAERVIGEMQNRGGRRGDIRVNIGPGLGRKSYYWKGDLPGDVVDWKRFVGGDAEGGWHIDALGYLVNRLNKMGVTNIADSGVDVGKDRDYFSHSRSHWTGEPEGRFATVACLL